MNVTMGDEADDVLHSFGMTDANSKKCQKDEEQFETYFVKINTKMSFSRASDSISATRRKVSQ